MCDACFVVSKRVTLLVKIFTQIRSVVFLRIYA